MTDPSVALCQCSKGYYTPKLKFQMFIRCYLFDRFVSISSPYDFLSISQRVERILQTHDSSQPLFMYMAFQNVHAPIQAPEKYIEKYEFIKDKTRRVHAAMADILDEAVGNITDAFKTAGLVVVETI